MRIPKPILYTWLSLSALLNVIGLSSIVSGIVVWHGFISELIDLYQAVLRDSLYLILFFMWPTDWPRPPKWIADILIIQSSFYISFRIFTSFHREQFSSTLIQESRLMKVLAFLGGPIVPFFLLAKLYRKANIEYLLAEEEVIDGENAEKQYLTYGATNLPILSGAGWTALDKRQLAGLEAAKVARKSFLTLNMYYLGFFLLMVLLIFINYQINAL